MRVGTRLRELWQIRGAVVACVAVALAAAVWSVARVSVVPPGLESRSLGIATATSQILVDTPKSALLDLRQSAYDLEDLTKRAVLLGNVIASDPVRDRIADRAGVPPEVLEIAAPLTPAQPRPPARFARESRASDILRSGDQYRLNVQANPSVPLLDVYAQTPDPSSAAALANAAVAELERELRIQARADGTPAASQIRLRQLGRAEGRVINDGVELQLALVVFLVVLALSCAAAIALNRTRRGWRAAAVTGPQATP